MWKHLLILAATCPALAQQAGGQTTMATRLDAGLGLPTLDGRLDEAAWQVAQTVGDFVQFSPRPGAPSTQRTEARVLFSDDAIYVGIRLYDTAPDSIAAQLGRRDANGIHSDWAHVYLDSYRDHRTAFGFSVTPAGVKRDVLHFNDASEDASWDAVWDVATAVDSLGWTAEFRIPLSQLRFRAGSDAWGINFGRDIARLEERSYWAPVHPNSGRFVSFAGRLEGLQDLTAPRRVELQPYSVTRVTAWPTSENPFQNGTALGVSAGGDLRYGVSSNLTVSATLNPDFGQVEADPSQVNLTAYETFLPERRPFFVDGADLFRFELGQVDPNNNERLFYSRRIGRAPQRRPDAGGYVDLPETTTILAATKLAGKLPRGWSVGVLNAITAAEQAPARVEGELTSFAVEPLTSYTVGRVSRDFREGSSALGGVATLTNRRIEENSDLDFLRSLALVGGIDGRHRFGANRYEIRTSLLGSHVQGSPRAIERTQRSAARYFQRPGATHLHLDPTRTSMDGFASTATLEKISGGNWRWLTMAAARSPGFEANDIGYLRIADAASLIAGGSYVQRQPNSLFRNWSTRMTTGRSWTFGGERFMTATVLEGGAQLHNFWSTNAIVVRLAPAISTTALRGGPGMYTPAIVFMRGGFDSDPRRPVRLRTFAELTREDGTVGASNTVGTTITVRPSDRTSLSLEPRWASNRAQWHYLRRESVEGEPRYVGGQLDQTTLSMTGRLAFTFTPTTTLELYAQPFVSAGRFDDYREVADPLAPALDARFRPRPESRGSIDADFSEQQFRANTVLRWEYRPGSTIFLVWSQGRVQTLDDGTFALGRDLGRLFGRDLYHPAPSTNVLLVKVSYWFDH